ncbi:DNA/RNA non-specific endonuclease [Vibrio hannami]|uniref:DNA/RNA non-specific endonuclease n=1 Tax=Vibrio hannami TaxID=2717094 RepID=UPI00240FAAE0|nr:DNA/RNA non-specific endonuclease [Vibrio hannami]MDG3087726.1 DNA/RNA non-specific endonuclease [Vibrio hannami]
MKSSVLIGLLSTVFTPAIVTSAFAATLSVHCPQGCPTNPDNNDLVFTHIYALSNNPETKFADWVAYEVNPINFGASPGRTWKSDPLLEQDETLEKADYSGASSTSLQADRGHQAPLASFAGSRFWYEANYLSNITPQDKDLNQGPWKQLEEKVRNAATYDSPLYVITGPVFDEKMPSLPKADENHTVPSGYFKVIYDGKHSIGFLMAQNVKRSENACSKIVKLEEIQTQLSFTLPKLPFDTELQEKLGCW